MQMRPQDAFERGPLQLRRRVDRHAPKDDSLDVRELVSAIWRGRWRIGAITLACAILAAMLVSQVTPKYSAVAKILLDPRESRLTTGDDVVSDLVLSDQVIESEISIIRSNVLLERVVSTIGTDRLSPLTGEGAKPGLITRSKDTVKSLLGLDKSSPMDTAARNAARTERAVWAIRKSVDAWRSGESYVIMVMAETVDPRLSALIASTIAEQYIELQLEGRRETAAQATRWIEERVEDLRAQVGVAEDKVQDFKASALVADGSSVDIITQQMIELNNQLVNARVERVAAETKFNEVQRLIEIGGLEAPAGLLESAGLDQLASERTDLIRRDAIWAERYSETHPERARIRRELARLETVALDEMRRALEIQQNAVELARLRERTMQQSLNEMEQRVVEASRSAIGLRQLEREADAARLSYEQLLSRLAETRTQEKFQTADARMIESASTPGSPSSPRPKLMTVVGAMIGAILGLSLVLFRELTDATFKTLADLESETGLPVVAVFPTADWNSPRSALAEIGRDPFGVQAERVRSLRTSLSLNSNRSRKSHSIALLSSLPNEGKTTLTLLLAQISELAEKSVVVVDCDLRRPSLASLFRFETRHDFADVIRGRATVDEAICYDTGVGFDVLAARKARPEIADLMTADWLADVIEELKFCYDVVLVNTPALLSVSDALVVAQAVDQRVYLVEHDRTPKEAVRRGLNTLSDAGLHVSGVVLTKVDPERRVEPYATAYEPYHA